MLKPRSAASSAQARSATAVIVSNGFTPTAPGMAAPSHTYKPSCTALPSEPKNTWHLWLTTPTLASSPMPQPPTGCTVTSL